MRSPSVVSSLLFIFLLFFSRVSANKIFSTGASECLADSQGNAPVISVTGFSVVFDADSLSVSYSVTGTARSTVNAAANITVTLYGMQVLQRVVKFCEYDVTELCPIKQDTDITISGTHAVPAKYVSSMTELVFKIPDLEGAIQIEIIDADSEGTSIGCFRSDISNGNTAEIAQVKYGTAIAAVIALVTAMVSSSVSSGGGSAGGGAGGGSAGTAGTAGTGTGAGAVAPVGADPSAAAAVKASAATPSGFPGISVLVGWLQIMATNGLYSVTYPKVYRSFTRNFSWSCGILQWNGLENAIDNLRSRTGGNLTAFSVQTLQNTTLIESPPSEVSSALSGLNDTTSHSKRYIFPDGVLNVMNRKITDLAILKRDSNSSSSDNVLSNVKYVTGIEAYLEKNSIPAANGFSTLLIWWCIIVAAIIVLLLGFKVGLELYYTESKMRKIEQDWINYESGTPYTSIDGQSGRQSHKSIFSLHSSSSHRNNSIITLSSQILARLSSISGSNNDLNVPKPPEKPRFQDYRKEYTNILRKTLIRTIAILYGVWVLLTLYQFTLSDSWCTTLLAALTFGSFTLILLLFSIRIWYLVYHASGKKAVNIENFKKGPQSLYDYEPWIKKYGVFYDEFKVDFWWVFVLMFIAVFGRNAFISLGVGHPIIQIIGQLVIDCLLFLFFFWFRPFNTKMGNGLNIGIQVVRIVSLVLTFLFTTVVNLSTIRNTVVGIILVAIQSTLTVILILLILGNFFKGVVTGWIESHKEKRKLMKERRLREEQWKKNQSNGENLQSMFANNDSSRSHDGSFTSGGMYHDDYDNDIDNINRSNRDNYVREVARDIQLLDLRSPFTEADPDNIFSDKYEMKFDSDSQEEQPQNYFDDDDDEFSIRRSDNHSSIHDDYL